MLLQFSGRIGEAEALLERCLERWPAFGDALTVLVNLHHQHEKNHRLNLIETQLQRLGDTDNGSTPAFVRAQFEYARFKTLDDLGVRTEAWDSLTRCNNLMRAINPYDTEAEAATAAALIQQTAMPARQGTSNSPGPMPIFIVGMPRSGTTLLDRILSSHPQVASAGEIIDFWRQIHWAADVPPARAAGLMEVINRSSRLDYHELGERYLAQTRWRAHGKAWYIDKLPANIQMVGFIHRALPHAPILHMVRAPMDIAFSNYKALFGNIAAYSYDFTALAHYFGLYTRLVRHWHAVLPGVMLDVSYADLVEHTEAVVQRVLAYCGLPLDDACLHPERNASPVATPSSAQVRKAIHTHGIGQWQRYAHELEPLRQLLLAQDVIV